MEDRTTQKVILIPVDKDDQKTQEVCKKFTPYPISLTNSLRNRLIESADISGHSFSYWLHALLLFLTKPLRVIKEKACERVYAQAELPDAVDVVAVTAPVSTTDPSPHVVIGHLGEL